MNFNFSRKTQQKQGFAYFHSTSDSDRNFSSQLKAGIIINLFNFFQGKTLLPTILTTSYKLSTGVDARNVRNIVLMRPIQNIVEFKQIIGRGTRLFDNKFYFTIYDFVGASEKFNDDEWDGDPVCPKCGNWPCTCNKHKPGPYPNPEDEDSGHRGVHDDIPTPCPICGNLPCTCEGKKTLSVRLSDYRKMTLQTSWEEKIFFGDEFISLEEYVKRLFGRLPDFFSGDEELRDKWSNPETRAELLQTLEDAGFDEEKLIMLRNMLKLQKCDLLDVLEYIAFESTPMERAARVKVVQDRYVKKLTKEQQLFDNFILNLYANNGFKELDVDKLKTLINIKYGSMSDAKSALNMTVPEIRSHYFELQHQLYHIPYNAEFHLHFGDNATEIRKR